LIQWCLYQNPGISRKNFLPFLIPCRIFCPKFRPDRPKIRFCMTFRSSLLKSSFQESPTSKWVFLKTWIWDDSTSKRPKKENSRATGFKFSAEYAGSDTEISGAETQETNFPTYAWVLPIVSHIFGIRYSYYGMEKEEFSLSRSYMQT